MQSAYLLTSLVTLCGLESSLSAVVNTCMAFGPPGGFLYHNDSMGDYLFNKYRHAFVLSFQSLGWNEYFQKPFLFTIFGQRHKQDV